MKSCNDNFVHRFLLCILIFGLSNCQEPEKLVNPPNVILILTDDLGIGDLGCQGNPWLKTPNIDAFYKESIRMTDFHVSPLCTPTRSAIITGQYPINNGAWATYKGRDALSENAITIADIFKTSGYKTGMFGKWHLGDNYPSRATDAGFDFVIQHLAGGVGELSDHWGNSYFDDVYYMNNEPKQFEGYCTDIWFEESMKFIQQNKEKPFFVYLPTNAPHDPLIVDEKYSEPYKPLEGEKIVDANLYGMISNIDENFGKLRKFLRDNELEDNTILIFMSDNGTRFGYSKDGQLGYNKGYEGIKGSVMEGGHIVPFFIRWPNGNLQGGKDISSLAAHVDILPTLANLCGVSLPKNMPYDGIDLSTTIKTETELNDRIVFLHQRQDWRPPDDRNHTCILKKDWRLLNGQQLYHISEDKKQQNNVAERYPQIVKELLNANQKFVEISKTNEAYQDLPVNTIGHPAQKEIKLTVQHAIGDDNGIWKSEQISSGVKSKNNTHALKIYEDGWYEIACRRWPKECAGPIWGTPQYNPKNQFDYKAIHPDKAVIKIANHSLEQNINDQDEAITFKVKLQKGKSLLINDFVEGTKKYGVYYTYIKKVDQ